MRIFIFLTLFLVSIVSSGQTMQEAKLTDVSINSMGDINWSVTYKGRDGCRIHLEKLVAGQWTTVIPHLGVFTISSPKDPPTVNTLTLTTRIKFHKGTNIYRLVMTYPEKALSEEFKLESEVSNDDGNLWIMNNRIILEESVQFEVLNSNGETVKKGEDKIIDISTLPSGSYFLYTKAWTRQFAK